MNPEDYIFWRGALKGEFPYAMQDGAFECGFWRTKNRDGKRYPVAIWKDEDGEICIKVGHDIVDPEKFTGRWNFCWQDPIMHKTYQHWMENGEWPGDIPHSIGHNAPPDEFQMLEEDIESAASDALRWLESVGELERDEDADKAANWRDALKKRAKKAEALRKDEKQPHMDAAREVDQKFKPIIDRAEKSAKTLADALTRLGRRRQEEERRKAEEARRAAEEARKKAEAENAPPPKPEPEPQPAKPQFGGQTGRKVGMRTRHVAEITDYRAALEHFADHPDVVAVVERLCNAEARSRTRKPIQGVEYKEESYAA